MQPIIVKIKYIFRKDGGVAYDGKAGPHVTSGAQFGGNRSTYEEGDIETLIMSERRQFKLDYPGRPVIVKLTIQDEISL